MRRKWRRSWARSKPDQQSNRLVKSFQEIPSWKTMAKCLLPIVAAAGLMINSMGITYALPTEVVTKAGNVTVSQSGNTMTVNETSKTGIVNSKTFVINGNETLNIYQPSSSASLLWKVLGNDPSAIYGHLNANGQLFLYNPQGTLFARGAQVNVGSLVATSLNITDSDYLAGNYKFSGTDSSGTVVNQGTITAADGGYVALLAPQVANDGVIVAQQGTVALAAGSAVTLDLDGDGLLNLAVDKSAVDASAANHNLIQADGGQVIMTASAASDLTRTAVNNSGVILARSAKNVNGTIRLDGGTNGAVVNSGTLDASGKNPGETGGTVKVLGKEVTLTGTAKVNVSGDNGGGTALIGGNTQGKGSEQNATTTTVADGATIKADAVTNGDGGKVVVWANGTTDYEGMISATGGSVSGNGGSAEVSGKQTLLYKGYTDLRAANGTTGTLLLDPGEYTISTGATGGNVYNVTELGNQLNSANITLATDGTGTGNITVAADLTNWTSGNTLTLKANNDINVNATIKSTGSGNVVLRADSDANDTGTVNFGTGGKVVTDGTVSVYYNPSGTTTATINGTSTTVKNFNNPTDYSAYVKNTSGDNGNLTAYMLVNNVNELQAISLNSTGGTSKYALGCDIDASATKNWNSGAGFVPINSDWGLVVDGDGHAISGLYIDDRTDDNVGLFGCVNDATIRNLGLKDVNINSGKGGQNVGALAGSLSGAGTATNCYVTGGSVTGYLDSADNSVGGLVGISCTYKGITNCYSAVTVQGYNAQNVGGLAGKNEGSTISNSYSTGTVAGSGSFIGGLVGYNGPGWYVDDDLYNGRISNSYSSATVTSTGSGSYVGGLVGNNNNWGWITSCYSTGAVTSNGSSSHVGGLVGGGGSYDSLITGSYSSGAVTSTGSGSYVGGFIGGTGDPNAFTACYWDSDSSGQQNGSGDGNSIAGLTALSTSGTDPYTKSSYSGFDFGTTWYMVDGSTRPFLQWEYSTTITNAHQLQLMVENLSTNYTLAANIDLKNFDMGRKGGFVPIGTGSTSAFTGSLDGNGYAINNLTITGSTADAVGLFGYIGAGATVSNIGLYNVKITGAANNTYVGSLAGYNAGTITNAYSTGSVGGYGTVGGLIGLNNGTVQTAYTTAKVVGNGSGSKAGGLAGENDGKITNVYSTGNVSGTTSSTLGGLVGYAGSDSNIVNSYWDTGTSGIGGTQGVGNITNDAGVTGLTTAQMMDETYLEGLGFDFTNTWYMIDGSTRPFLKSEYSTIITNAHQLQLMAKDLSATYTLGSNIDLSELSDASGMWRTSTTADSNGSYGFVPIGNSSTPFTGMLVGYGHTVSGLTINNSSLTAAGLFGYIKDATINDISLKNVTITAGSGSYAGGLVGENDGGSITNACLSGTATLSGGTAGGLAGLNSGNIIDCYNSSTGTVTGSIVGGLVGTNGGSVTSSYNAASIAVSGDGGIVGGLVGKNTGRITSSYNAGIVSVSGDGSAIGGVAGINTDTGSITGSYNTGTVTGIGGNEKVGGVVGQNAGSITNSYNANYVAASGAGSTIGGVAGTSTGTGSIVYCYNVGTVIGNASLEQVGGVAGQNAGSISGSYNAASVAASSFGSTIGGVTGVNTKTGSIISSYGAAAGTVSSNAGSNLVGGVAGENDGSILGSFNNGEVNTTASATNNKVGGLVGLNAADGSLTKSYNTGTLSVSGDNSLAGGLAGENDGSMASSTNAGAVTSTGAASPTGGLAGINSGSITTSYSVGNVSGYYSVGGLVGTNAGSITDSYYAIATVNGYGSTSKTGGIAGVNGGTIATSCNSGGVTGGGLTGGLVGDGTGGTITSAVWDINKSGQQYGVGSDLTAAGVTGLTTYQMSKAANYPGNWDFTKTWTLTATGPRLQWQDQTNLTITTLSTIDAAAATSIDNTLNSGTDVTLVTSQGSANSGDIDVDSALSWASGKTLTLSAYQDVNINASITSTGGGSVVLRADNGGNDSGTVNFGTNGKVVTDGAVSIYYNPVGTTSTTINGIGILVKNFADPTDYSAYVKSTSGGTGSLTAYMLVNNVTELQAIQVNLGGTYALGKDIDASSTYSWNSGAGFTTFCGNNPDWGGDSSTPFTGIFNGDGHVISGLYINSSGYNSGLFGAVKGTVRNLGLENVSITGSGTWNGALAGYNTGTITNCYVTGTVTGSNEDGIGGLVGYSKGTITGSYSTASVQATNVQYVGGLVGENDGHITDSYSTGNTGATSSTGSAFTGGLVGYNSGGTISDSYSTGAVTSNAKVGWFSHAGTGGLVGYNTNGGTIENSYSTGKVSGNVTITGGYSDAGTGGLVGENYGGTISESYSTGTVIGSVTITGDSSYAGTGGLVGYNSGGTIADSYSTGAVTDSDSVAYVGGLAGYNVNGGTISGSYSVGEVTGSGSYVGGFIGGTDNADNITASYWDIDSSGRQNGSGDGSSISGLSGLSVTGNDPYTKSSYNNFDFGTTWYMVDGSTRPFLQWEYSTTITNAHQLQLMAMDLSANYTLAANIDLIGYNMARSGFSPIGTSSTPFTGSLDGNGYAVNNLTITSPATDAVGLFGYIGPNAIVSSIGLYNVDIVGGTASAYVGSLAGYNAGTVTNAYSTGSVSGSGTVGGLVGLNNGTVEFSYATAQVDVDGGSGKAGGLVGENDKLIGNVYSSGKVSGAASSTLGGLVGYAGSGSTICDSGWDTNTSGIGGTQGVGNVINSAGVTGLTTVQMMDMDYLTALGFDFTNTWYMVDGATRPFLRSENVTSISNAHQLQLMGANLSAIYTLKNDIDLSELTKASGMWNIATGFVPVGSSSTPFTGVVFGGGHTISGLIVNNPGLTAAGLFGYIKDATINNLSLSDVTITAGSGSYVGSLVGENDGGSIINAGLSGAATLSGGTAGGLVGLNTGSITVSYNAGTVSVSDATKQVGGVAGINSGTIINSYNAGTVTGSGATEQVGGVAGANTGTIINSYNAGTVTGSGDIEQVGGVAGNNTGSITGSYTKTGATVNVSGDGSLAGGVAGSNAAAGTISNSYNAGTVSGIGATEQVGGVAGANAGSLTSCYNAKAGGSVSISGDSSDAGGVAGVNTGTITSSYNAAGQYAVNSLGYDSSNLTVAAGTVTGSGTNEQVGGVAGQNAGSITSSYNAGVVSISGDKSAVGAVAGDNTGTISKSYNAEVKTTGNYGTVSAAYTEGKVISSATGSFVGGLVGENAGTVTACYNWGTVTATGAGTTVGGLDGWNQLGGIISNSYSGPVIVTVSGDGSIAGGLVGQNDGIIAYTYAVTPLAISGTGSKAGGLVGVNGSDGKITNSFWDTEIADVNRGIGSGTSSGVTGLTTAQMMQSSTYTGWDLALFPTIAYNNSNSYYYPVSSLTTSWTTLDGCSFPFFSWQYGTYIKGEACSYPFQFISGTVKDGGAGETVVIGSNNTSAKTISASGFYYTIAAGNTAGKLMVLYVTGDDNYKANAWYRTGINGLANADLIKDTLIDSAEVAAQNCSFLLSKSPTVPAADSIYTCSNGVLSVNGNLIIDYCGDANTVFMINSPVIATGDITVDAGNGSLLIDDLFTKIYASNYYYGGGKLTAGGNITIIANNGFFNNVGADALQLTGSGRWLIYGSDPLLDQSDMLYYFQNKFIQSYQSIQKTWQGTSSAAWYPNAWKNSFQSYMDSNWDMYIDGRGGLTGGFTQWDTAYGGAVPAAGNGFVYTELDPALRPLTQTQQQRAAAITDAHTYNVDGQAPVVPAAASSLMVTINGEGVATEPTDSVRLTEKPSGESDKPDQNGTGPTTD